MSSKEEREQNIYDMSKAIYRGNFRSKNGWDPGDPDDIPPALSVFVVVMLILMFLHFCGIELG